MQYWGKLGAFWGGIWGLLFGAAFFAIPGIGPVLGEGGRGARGNLAELSAAIRAGRGDRN